MINLIWAMTSDYVIGKGNELSWKIPAEMKYFSKTTSGSTVLMGSKTFESIGKSLKGRYNIVLTRNKEKYKNRKEENLVFADDLNTILVPYKANPNEHIFVIGGSEIYKNTYHCADYYYVSIVKGLYEGNVYFPFRDWNKGELIKKEKFADFVAYVYKK